MVIKKDISKETRINKEERRLRRIYKDVQKDKLSVVDGLIRRASFMRTTLEDMEIDLDLNGFNELFSQSPTQEPYERERPVARQYQQMNKNYQAICKQLSDLLPKGDGNNKIQDDGFDNFVSDRDD